MNNAENAVPDLTTGPQTFEVKPMGDRVALVLDTPSTAYIFELRIEQAETMLAQMLEAISLARQAQDA